MEDQEESAASYDPHRKSKNGDIKGFHPHLPLLNLYNNDSWTGRQKRLKRGDKICGVTFKDKR